MKKEESCNSSIDKASRREEIRRTLVLWERGIEAKQREREQGRLQVLTRAQEELPSFFRRKKVEKVYLTGSLLQEGNFYSFSDIDLGGRMVYPRSP